MDTLEPTAVDTHVSAEQILRDVYKKGQKARGSTNIDILDLEELREYQRRKRTEYEGYLKRNRLDMGQWIRYAAIRNRTTRHEAQPDLSLKEHY